LGILEEFIKRNDEYADASMDTDLVKEYIKFITEKNKTQDKTTIPNIITAEEKTGTEGIDIAFAVEGLIERMRNNGINTLARIKTAEIILTINPGNAEALNCLLSISGDNFMINSERIAAVRAITPAGKWAIDKVKDILNRILSNNQQDLNVRIEIACLMANIDPGMRSKGLNFLRRSCRKIDVEDAQKHAIDAIGRTATCDMRSLLVLSRIVEKHLSTGVREKAIDAIEKIYPAEYKKSTKWFPVSWLINLLKKGIKLYVEWRVRKALISLAVNRDRANPARTKAVDLLGKLSRHNYTVRRAMQTITANDEETDELKIAAAQAISRIGIGNPTMELRDIMEGSKSAEYCIAAAVALSRSENSGDRDKAVEYFNNIIPIIFGGQLAIALYGDSLDALARCAKGNKGTISMLETIVKEGVYRDYMRIDAAGVLGKIDEGNATAIGMIQETMAGSSNTKTIIKAAEFLYTIDEGNEDAVSALTGIVEDEVEDIEIRWKAALALNRLEIKGNTVIKEMLEFAKRHKYDTNRCLSVIEDAIKPVYKKDIEMASELKDKTLEVSVAKVDGSNIAAVLREVLLRHDPESVRGLDEVVDQKALSEAVNGAIVGNREYKIEVKKMVMDQDKTSMPIEMTIGITAYPSGTNELTILLSGAMTRTTGALTVYAARQTKVKKIVIKAKEPLRSKRDSIISSRFGSYGKIPEDGVSPIPTDEMPEDYINDALDDLERNYPAQAHMLKERVTHYYFGEHMPSAAGVLKLGENTFFFVEEKTRDLMEKCCQGLTWPKNHILYLLALHEATELILRQDSNTFRPDINHEIIAFIFKSQAFLELCEDKSVSHNLDVIARDMDKDEPDIEDRFLPVFQKIRSLKGRIPANLNDITEDTLREVEEFIKRDDEYKDAEMELYIVRTRLGWISDMNQAEIFAREKVVPDVMKEIPDVVKEIVTMLAGIVDDKELHEFLRVEAINALKEIGLTGDEEVIRVLTKVVENEEKKWVQYQAAAALGVLDPGNTQAIALLRKIISDEKDVPSTKVEAGEALARIIPGDKQAMTVLKEMADFDNSGSFHANAIFALGRAGKGNRGAIHVLKELALRGKQIKSDRVSLFAREHGIRALADAGEGDDEVLEFLRDLELPDQDDVKDYDRNNLLKCKIARAYAMAKLDPNDASAKAELRTYVTDLDDLELRGYAAELLGEVESGNQDAVEVLLDIGLPSEAVKVEYDKQRAIKALGKAAQGNDYGKDFLHEILTDIEQNEEVYIQLKEYVIAALGMIDKEYRLTAIDKLKELYVDTDEDPNTRCYALRGIAALCCALMDKGADIKVEVTGDVIEVQVHELTTESLIEILTTAGTLMTVKGYNQEGGTSEDIPEAMNAPVGEPLDFTLYGLDGDTENRGWIKALMSRIRHGLCRKVVIKRPTEDDTVTMSTGIEVVENLPNKITLSIPHEAARLDTERTSGYIRNNVFDRQTIVIRTKLPVTDLNDIDYIIIMLLNALHVSEGSYANQDDSSVEAINALGEFAMNNEEVISFLLSMKLRDSDTNLRIAIINALGKIAPENKEAAEYLLNILKSKEISMDFGLSKVSAAKALGSVGKGSLEVYNSLKAIMNDSSYSFHLRVEVMRSLGMLDSGNKEAIAILEKEIKKISNDVRYRIQACGVLGELDSGSDIAIEIAFKLLSDQLHDTKLRTEALEVLLNIGKGNKKVLNKMIDLLTKRPNQEGSRHALIETLMNFDYNVPLEGHIVSRARLRTLKNRFDMSCIKRRIVDVLIERAGDSAEDIYARKKAMEALIKMADGNKKALRMLKGVIEDEDQGDNIRLDAAITLIKMDPKNIRALEYMKSLLHAIEETDKAQKGIEHVGEREIRMDPMKKAAAVLLTAIPDKMDRFNEILSILKSAAKLPIDYLFNRALIELAELVKDEDSLKAEAGRVIWEILDNVDELFKDSTHIGWYKAQLAMAICKIYPGHEKALKVLRDHLLTDDEEGKRDNLAAAKALAIVGPDVQEAKAYLYKEIENRRENGYSQLRVVDALLEIDPDDEKAITTLAEIITNHEKYEDYTRKEAIKKLEARGRLIRDRSPPEKKEIVSSRLGLYKVKRDASESPIPDEEIQPPYLDVAKALLERSFPAQAHVLNERVTHYYFGEYMPSAAGILKMADNTFFFIEDKTRDLLNALPNELKDARDMILYLLTVHESTELMLRDENDTIKNDINTEVVAFLYKVLAYNRLNDDLRGKIKAAVEIMDKEEKDIEDRFGPVLYIADSLRERLPENLEDIDDAVLTEIEKFIKTDPDYASMSMDIAAVQSDIKFIQEKEETLKAVAEVKRRSEAEELTPTETKVSTTILLIKDLNAAVKLLENIAQDNTESNKVRAWAAGELGMIDPSNVVAVVITQDISRDMAWATADDRDVAVNCLAVIRNCQDLLKRSKIYYRDNDWISHETEEAVLRKGLADAMAKAEDWQRSDGEKIEVIKKIAEYASALVQKLISDEKPKKTAKTRIQCMRRP